MWKRILVVCAFAVLTSCAEREGDVQSLTEPKSSQGAAASPGSVHALVQRPSVLREALSDTPSALGDARKTETAGFAFKPARQYQPIFDSAYEFFDDVWIDDVNGDGRADLVASGSTNYNKIYVFTQKLDGSLSSPVLYPKAKVITVADFNENGVTDILFLELEGEYNIQKVGILLSNANGVMEHRIAYQQLPDESHWVWTTLDVDGDSHLDLVRGLNIFNLYGDLSCGNSNSSCAGYRVFFGDGKGHFTRTQAVQLNIAQQVFELESVDLNDDGRKDLIIPFAGTYPEIGSVTVAYALPAGGLGALKLLHPGYGTGGDT